MSCIDVTGPGTGTVGDQRRPVYPGVSTLTAWPRLGHSQATELTELGWWISLRDRSIRYIRSIARSIGRRSSKTADRRSSALGRVAPVLELAVLGLLKEAP